jgi:hypothetical protein
MLLPIDRAHCGSFLPAALIRPAAPSSDRALLISRWGQERALEAIRECQTQTQTDRIYRRRLPLDRRVGASSARRARSRSKRIRAFGPEPSRIAPSSVACAYT